MSLQDIPPAKPGKKSAASNAPTHDPNAPENQNKKHYIEIKLVDDAGKPVPGEPYKVTLPDGTTVADGTLDDKGFARVDNIDPGSCKVTFPNLDKRTWKPS
jgi:type VI secretion system secreted protein VgrG